MADAIEAACGALAAHFAAAVPSLADARVGWPEHRQPLDLSTGPLVTVTPVSWRTARCSPVSIDQTITAAPLADITWRVAWLTLPLAPVPSS